MKDYIKSFFNDKYKWKELTSFGNGKIINEQIYNKEADAEDELKKVDAAL